MANYRVPELDLSTRLRLAVEMLVPVPQRRWGRATELARTYGISRTLLYRLRDQAQEALMTALAPRRPGPAPQTEELVIDRDFLRRAITVFPLLKGTVRDIQLGLELLFGVHCSIGFISETLQEAGQKATTYQAGLSIPLPVLGEADEIFQGRRPCLTVVDGRSFLVLHLAPAEARDGTTWGLTFLELQEQGIQFQDLASDGARDIQAGVREAQLAIPLRPDLFHLLREALGLEAGDGFPASLQPVVQAFWEAFSLLHRSSSLAEALHSWLRPYLQIHRGMPAWLWPLLKLYWNHHRFQRGKRAGKSPLELAGAEDVPSLSEVLTRVSSAQPAPVAV